MEKGASARHQIQPHRQAKTTTESAVGHFARRHQNCRLRQMPQNPAQSEINCRAPRNEIFPSRYKPVQNGFVG